MMICGPSALWFEPNQEQPNSIDSGVIKQPTYAAEASTEVGQ